MTGAKLVHWHPGNSNLFAQYTGQLELCSFEDHPDRRVVVHKSCALKNLSTFNWQQGESSSIVACGSFSGQVMLINWKNSNQINLSDGKVKAEARRSCYDISWSSISPNKLVAGFDASKSESSISVWDLQHMKALKLKSIDACCSLSWLLSNDSLVLSGTGTGWLKAFDLRSPNAPCLFWHAHPFNKPRKVKGIRPHLSDPNIIATFSDGGGDVVKIWDLRYVDTKSKKTPLSFNVNPYSMIQSDENSSISSMKLGVINDVAWSPIKNNSIAISTSSQQVVGLFQYDQSKMDQYDHNNVASIFTTSQPSNVVKTTEIVKSISWLSTSTHKSDGNRATSNDLSPALSSINYLLQPEASPVNWESASQSLSTFEWQEFSRGGVESVFDLSDSTDNKLRPKRLLGISLNGLFDTDFRDNAPFGINGNVVVQTAFNVPSVKVMVRIKADYDSNTDKLVDYLEDSSQIQKHRALAGYSIDASTNLDVVSEELDMLLKTIERNHHEHHTNDNFIEVVKFVNDVHKVWLWVDRYEVSNRLSKLSLRECGIMSLLKQDLNNNISGSNNNPQPISTSQPFTIHPVTGAKHFNSANRKLIKEFCGWVDIPIVKSGGGGSQRSSFASEKSMSEAGDEDDFHFEGGGGRGDYDEDYYDEDEPPEDLTYFNQDSNDLIKFDQREEEEAYLEQKELLDILIEECLHDSFERAAAIALWHGEMDLCVQILYHAIEEFPQQRKQPTSVEEKDAHLDDGMRSEYSQEYIQLVTMVATCFAGYYFPPISSTASNTVKQPIKWKGKERTSWKTMCNHVISMLQTCQRKSAAYLLAGCQFLLMNCESCGEDSSYHPRFGKTPLTMYTSILENEDITIEDQISFAAIYLNDDDFHAWSKQKLQYCLKEGLLQGLFLTGLLTKNGFEVLQHYLDKTNDIQTVALLSSRIFYSISELDTFNQKDGSASLSSSNPVSLDEAVSLCEISKNWLFHYRNMLNRWELYTERAYFDLEIQQKVQKKKDSLQAMLKASNQTAVASRSMQVTSNNSFNRRPGGPNAPASAGVALLGKPVFEEIFQSLRIPTNVTSGGGGGGGKSIISHPLYFSYIKLKCSFCGMSLPLDDISMKKVEQLRSQKHILNCCPHCCKSLPRCYICQLQLGMANPYVHLDSIMSQRFEPKSKSSTQPKEQKMRSSINGLAAVNSKASGEDLQLHFDKWFLFCQRCRHGGHTQCMNAWFTSYDLCEESSDSVSSQHGARTCGVNGCSCECRW